MAHRARWLALALLAGMTLLTAPAHAAFGDRPLSRGDHGHDVRVLQRWLTLVGFSTRSDGSYGPKTVSSVRRYERARGQAVDGRFSVAQARGLRARAYAARAAAASASPQTEAAPGETAVLSSDGRTALAPASAPAQVKAAIAAANAIVDTPYRYGGGHASFRDSAYDCSGAVSYMLHGGGLLAAPEDSGALMSFGSSGTGSWITLYSRSTHVYAIVAGLRFDTSGPGESGPRWRTTARSSAGFTVRHPTGL